MDDKLKQYLPPEALAALERAEATKWGSTDLSGDVPMLCQMLAEARAEIAYAERFYNLLGDIGTGDTLRERVENVVRHYANQMGRWVEENR